MRLRGLMVAVMMLTTLSYGQHLGSTGYTKGRGLIGIAQLGPHENGGRACMSCHAPHTGTSEDTRTLAGFLVQDKFVGAVTYGEAWSNIGLVSGEVGGGELWGESVGPVHVRDGSMASANSITAESHTVDLSRTESGAYGRMNRGIMLCLTCHDGQVAAGGMMTNETFERVAGLLPPDYGSNYIPTLLGSDRGPRGNYRSDHPIGPGATLSEVGIGRYVTLDSFTSPTKLVASGWFQGSAYQMFQLNYGLPVVLGAREGFGWAVDSQAGNGVFDSDYAYVVCTTCHTPHSMHRAPASEGNPIARLTSGAFPSWSFLAGPYNPDAPSDYGRYASSATQFCRQCHFSGEGGANEAVGIDNIRTAF